MMVVYAKAYPLRHIGHLDLMRTMQRALRRSGLPVAYSHGFNPHIKMSFASPLSVGIAGEREIFDVSLESACGEEEFLRALNGVMPENLPICGARLISDEFPTLMGLAAGSRFRMETETPASAFEGAIQTLLTLAEYRALRKTKSGEAVCDVLPYIHTLETRANAISFTARNLQSGSLKPAVVMDALFQLSQLTPCDTIVTREAILASNADGGLTPLEGIAYDGETEHPGQG